jgi:hypothetical protein
MNGLDLDQLVGRILGTVGLYAFGMLLMLLMVWGWEATSGRDASEDSLHRTVARWLKGGAE